MGRNQYDGEIEGQMSFEDFFPAPQRMFAVSKIFARARKQMNIDEYKTFVYALTNIDWTREMPETITLDKKELAEILGIDDTVGSLKQGKDADFSIFDCDPLTLAAKPVAVFIDGKAVYDTGIIKERGNGR